jgi:hypothetical protein
MHMKVTHWNPPLPYCADTFMTSKSIKLRKTCELTSFPPIFLERRHTTSFMPMKKETLIYQSLFLKQSLELKTFLASQWCTWTQVSWHPDIHWAYSRNAEYFLLGQYITVYLQNSNIEPNPKLMTSRKHCWLALFGTEYITDTDMGNFYNHICIHTQTQTYPQSGYVPWILSVLLKWISGLSSE